MRRRSFLGGAAAVAALGVPRIANAAERRLKIGIVGGGIIGASIAFHLAQAGADVTVFERTAPASGATRKSMAWINPFTSKKHYVELRLLSMAAWRELDIPLQLGVTWGGSLTWGDADEAEYVRNRAAPLDGTAHPARHIDAEAFASLSPMITPGPIAEAFFAAIDGHVEPVWATYRFLDAARQFGAKILYPCEVQGIDFKRNRLAGVSTTQGKFALDRLIAVSGVDTPRVLAMAGFDLKLRHAPGFVAHTLPIPEVTKLMYDGPGKFEFKQMTNGRIVAGFAPVPPDLPQHQGIRAQVMDFPDAALRQRHGERVLAQVREFLPAAKGIELDEVRLGFRPMPTDGHPVVGAVPGAPEIYTVVTHSGVTLAPILGRYAAQEVLTNTLADMLSPYRPQRFAANQKP
ncbi:MAG: FAD-binding oxidoreductase [Rhodospirillaceae bacterium]|nr:FAD-binding oxidoreductase [Rhodospirillaceae bacterium]